MRAILTVLLTAILMMPAAADEILDRYTAVLSAHDHYNSSGVRLTSAASVLAQDRANFHRFGNADAGDDWDGFFTTVLRRQMFDGMLDRGGVSSSVRNAIVNNEVVVTVEIYSGVGKGPYVTVWVH